MRFLGVLCVMVGLFWSSISHANVVITGTRVIYPAQKKEIGIELTNAGSVPALVQAWISDDEDNAKNATPFVITPPIARIEGDKRQTLRVIYTHEKALAQDRETLFYFNLLDIPPMPENGEGQNYLQLSLLSKLKFFYRPHNLKPNIDEAYRQLTVHQNVAGVTIVNPTPYYMTISKVMLLANKDDETPLSETTATPMIEPFGKADVVMDTSVSATIAQVELINDYGGRFSTPIALKTKN
ncbi:fimbrial biogenesis chaperone [Moraxella oblonga]|uniref:fimbrial biogenesis chaperone n=1 Tax=Moraxella oblonga TaxID=200413 RepID=UPI00082CC216|nr:molecular chaperone [Moraxella oblonga]